jgi:hypothetical protein
MKQMKKFIGAIMLTLMTVSLATLPTVKAEAQTMYYSGKNVSLKFPRGIDSSKVYMFPTWKYLYTRGQLWNDTLAIAVHDLETYFKCDSLKDNTLINVTNDAYVYPGAKLWLELGTSAADTARTVYLKYGTQTNDTISVTNTKIKRGPYIWNGTRYEYFPK